MMRGRYQQRYNDHAQMVLFAKLASIRYGKDRAGMYWL